MCKGYRGASVTLSGYLKRLFGDESRVFTVSTFSNPASLHFRMFPLTSDLPI